jgi:hypothetical protein
MNIEELKVRLSVDGIDETLAKLERIAELCTQIAGFGMDVASCNVIDARDGARLFFKIKEHVPSDVFDRWFDALRRSFPNNIVQLIGPEFGKITAIRTGTHAPE